MRIKCKKCGIDYDAPNTKHLYCDDCKKAMRRQRSREWQRKHNRTKLHDGEAKKCMWCNSIHTNVGNFCSDDCKCKHASFYLGEKPVVKQSNKLIEKNTEARNLGMSYGQLQAMRFMEGHGVQL